MFFAAILIAVACMAVVAPTHDAKAHSCTWVSGTIGNIYTEYEDIANRPYDHRTIYIWNDTGAPDVDSIYYWVNDDWVYIASGDIITYDGTYQSGPFSDWWGWHIDTSTTATSPLFNGWEGHWNDDWRWGAYINC